MLSKRTFYSSERERYGPYVQYLKFVQNQCIIKGQNQRGRNCVSGQGKLCGLGLRSSWVKWARGLDGGGCLPRTRAHPEKKTSVLCGEDSEASVRLEKVVCEQELWEVKWEKCSVTRSWRVVSTKAKKWEFLSV